MNCQNSRPIDFLLRCGQFCPKVASVRRLMEPHWPVAHRMGVPAVQIWKGLWKWNTEFQASQKLTHFTITHIPQDIFIFQCVPTELGISCHPSRGKHKCLNLLINTINPQLVYLHQTLSGNASCRSPCITAWVPISSSGNHVKCKNVELEIFQRSYVNESWAGGAGRFSPPSPSTLLLSIILWKTSRENEVQGNKTEPYWGAVRVTPLVPRSIGNTYSATPSPPGMGNTMT